MTTLEDRYRRLLAFLPAAHRAEYGDEMLGVLLSAAAPGQRHPRRGETADLMSTGVRMRLGRAGTAVRDRVAAVLRDRRSADAAALFGLVGAVLMLVLSAIPPLLRPVWRWRIPEPWGVVSIAPIEWARLAAWLIVVALLVAGAGRLAAVAAWATAAVEGWWVTTHYATWPGDPTRAWRPLALALAIALALSVPVPARRALALLGRRGRAWFTGAAVLATVGPVMEPVLAIYRQNGPRSASLDPWPGGGGFTFEAPWTALDLRSGSDGIGPATLLACLPAAVVGVWLLTRIERGVLLRALVPATALAAFTMLPQYEPSQRLGALSAFAVLVAVGITSQVRRRHGEPENSS